MADDEFEDYKAKARAGGETGMEQPEVRGRHCLVEAADPAHDHETLLRLSLHAAPEVRERQLRIVLRGHDPAEVDLLEPWLVFGVLGDVEREPSAKAW